MNFTFFKDPLSEDICVQIVISWKEMHNAYNAMHPIHRQLLNDYFKDESSAADKVFAISEIMKVVEKSDD